MKPRCPNTPNQKGSKANFVARKKSQTKKNFITAEILNKPIKKRGVYVEKKTSNPLTSNFMPAGVKFRRIKSYVSSADDKLSLIELALDVLSRITVSESHSWRKPSNVTSNGGYEGSMRNPVTPQFITNGIRKQVQENLVPVVVIKPKLNTTNPSSTCFSHESSVVTIERTDDSKTVITTVKKTKEDMSKIENSFNEAVDRSVSPYQSTKASQPGITRNVNDKTISTKTLVDKFKLSKRSDMSLYDFFVDLCKNKMNYDRKPQHVHGRRGLDDVSFTSITDAEFAPVVNDIAKNGITLSTNSSDSDIHIKITSTEPKTKEPLPLKNLSKLQQRPLPSTLRPLPPVLRPLPPALRPLPPALRPLPSAMHHKEPPKSLQCSKPQIKMRRCDLIRSTQTQLVKNPSPVKPLAPATKPIKKNHEKKCNLCSRCLQTFVIKDRFRNDRLYNLNNTAKKRAPKSPKMQIRYDKKNVLLTKIRDQLTVNSVDVMNEPRNLYQALKKLLSSKKKAEKYKAMEKVSAVPNYPDDLKFVKRKNKTTSKPINTDNVEPFNNEVINTRYYDFF